MRKFRFALYRYVASVYLVTLTVVKRLSRQKLSPFITSSACCVPLFMNRQKRVRLGGLSRSIDENASSVIRFPGLVFWERNVAVLLISERNQISSGCLQPWTPICLNCFSLAVFAHEIRIQDSLCCRPAIRRQEVNHERVPEVRRGSQYIAASVARSTNKSTVRADECELLNPGVSVGEG